MQGKRKYKLIGHDRIGAMRENFPSPNQLNPDSVNRQVLE